MTLHNHLKGSKTEFAQRWRPLLLGPAKPSPPVNCRSSEIIVLEDIVENQARHHLEPAKVSSNASVSCFRLGYSLHQKPLDEFM